MAQNWVGLWLGKWVGNWLGKLGAGTASPKPDRYYKGKCRMTRILSGRSEVTRVFKGGAHG